MAEADVQDMGPVVPFSFFSNNKDDMLGVSVVAQQKHRIKPLKIVAFVL